MFKPKHLYTVKQYYWFVFPTKEAAVKADRSAAGTAANVEEAADFWSKQLGCLVSFIEPNSNFMVLEVEGKFVKVVGDRVGWMVMDMSAVWVRESFEEITNVQT